MTTPTQSPSQYQLTQVEGWVNQWNQSTGYQFAGKISDAMIQDLALAIHPEYGTVATSLFDVARVMNTWFEGNSSTKGLLDSMPWAKYGLDQTQYRTNLQDYSSVYQNLTGQALSGSALDQAFLNGAGQYTSSEYEQSLKGDENFLNQFQWVKYGLDYQQFQQQKLTWSTLFGQQAPMTDTQGVQQLKYLHANQGADMQARMTPASPQQQTTAQTGGVTGTSAVR